MDVVKRAVAAVEARAPRVSLVLKADIRPGVTDGLTSKVETVERHLSELTPVQAPLDGVTDRPGPNRPAPYTLDPSRPQPSSPRTP